MSAQPQLPSLPEFQNQIQNHKSLLDEPWKVTLIPTAAPVGEDPHAAKSLPWRVGDVTRLKDDSPRGMMEYIATHSTGWWREMAERALRDTEKAERMAREQGWEYGQYWALEVDAEAKQKLLDAEEAKRAREEAARAKELAEKEAFVQRQMELLERAGRAPRCEYQYMDGRGCKAPQVRGERWCHGHAKMMSYRPEKLEILPMEDEQAVMVNLYRATQSLLVGRISEKTAGLILWSAAMVAPGLNRARKGKTKTYHGGTETRRKTNSPQMNADIHRSKTKISRELTRKNTNQQGCASRNLDGSHPAKPTAGLPGTPGSTPRSTPPHQGKSGLAGDSGTGASLTMTSRSAAKSARRGFDNSGVTNGKSFVSGVGGGRGLHRRDRRHRTTSRVIGKQSQKHLPQRAQRSQRVDNGKQSGSGGASRNPCASTRAKAALRSA